MTAAFAPQRRARKGVGLPAGDRRPLRVLPPPRGTSGALRRPPLVVVAAAGLVVVLALGLALRAEQAGAAFPSQNGKIAFTSFRDGNGEIYVMGADGTNQTRLTNNTETDAHPAFSPDGTKIAFTSARDGNSEIYVMGADGTNQTRLTNNTASDAQPTFSPDGTIAFTSARDGNSEIYVMGADGTNQTRLTNNTADDADPAFSPDGTKIAFDSIEVPPAVGVHGTYDIYVMGADGTNETRLTNNTADDALPAFSPDGTKIAFTSWRDSTSEVYPNGEVYVMGADGTNQTRLTSTGGTDTQPAFSPDGTKIAFASFREGNFEIYVMGADGTNQTRLTDPGGTEFEPDWGPAPVAPAVTIADLAASVKALGLDSGMESSLLRKLQEAEKNVARGDVAGACDKLASFSEQVAALAGKKITTSDAEQLIADTAAVRDDLGCAP